MKTFGGKILFLDRSDINTDEIIPARYLSESSKDDIKPYLLEDLKLPGFDPKHDLAGKGAVVTRANFGCGSSREHAPWALEMNGINIVIAESFARIFRQNMYNCGMIAAELPVPLLDEIFLSFASEKKESMARKEEPDSRPDPAEGPDTELSVDIKKGLLIFKSERKEKIVPFTLNDFEKALVEAGGWVEYAAKRY